MKKKDQILAEIDTLTQKLTSPPKTPGIVALEDGTCAVETEQTHARDYMAARGDGIGRFLTRNHQSLGLIKRLPR